MTVIDLGNQKKDQGKRPWHLLPWDASRLVQTVDLNDFLDSTDRDADELIFRAQERLTNWFQGEPELWANDLVESLACILRLLENEQEEENPDYVDNATPTPSLYLLGLSQVVDVLAFGARKYAPRGWEKGIEYSRCFSAAIRHIYAWYIEGERNDPETGLSHLAHAACEILFLVAFEERGRTDLDDRPGLIVEESEEQRYRVELDGCLEFYSPNKGYSSAAFLETYTFEEAQQICASACSENGCTYSVVPA